MKEEQKLKSIIARSATQNDGSLIHQYVKRKAKEWSDLSVLPGLFESIARESLFVAAREFIRLQDFSRSQNREAMLHCLEQAAEEVLAPAMMDGLGQSDTRKNNEAILAAYAIGDRNACACFLGQAKSAALHIRWLISDLLFDTDLEPFLYDIIVFLLDASRDLEDYDAHECIRSVRVSLNPNDVKKLEEQKYQELCRLAGWYYGTDRYGALGALMSLLESYPGNDNQCKKAVYQYIGIDRERFLQTAFAKKTAKSLELYYIVRFADRFPTAGEIGEILSCGNSQSVLCIVMQCLKKIIREGVWSGETEKVLSGIKTGLEKGELKFDILDEYEDRGMRIGKLDDYAVRCFQILCANRQDVMKFISLISFFNVFGNTELRLNFNIAKYDGVQKSEWKKEYAYICDRYREVPNGISYVVMNSYLKMFVDVFDFVPRCGEYLNKNWFLGYLTNSGKLGLLQEKNNPEFKSRPYHIQILHCKPDANDAPEEIRYVRFRITGVDPATGTVCIRKIQTISSQMKQIIANKVWALLLNGRIPLAYGYLKGFEQSGRNLLGRDRFTSVGTLFRKEADQVERVMEKAGQVMTLMEQAGTAGHETERAQLAYIYLNSFLKTIIPWDKVMHLFDGETYLLANIYYEDNPSGDRDCFYIRPNYYAEENPVLSVQKKVISPELRCFIEEQLEWMKQNQSPYKYRGMQENQKSVRVCFRAAWESGAVQDGNFVTQLYLHCGESMIRDLSSAMCVYYTRIQKIFRKGISQRILVKYIRGCKEHLRDIVNAGDEEFYGFIETYFKYLHSDIYAILFDEGAIWRWLYKGVTYNKINLFVMMDEVLFDEEDYYNAENLAEAVKKSDASKKVMEDLKSCERMRKPVYEKTILKYVFADFGAFEEAIEESPI